MNPLRQELLNKETEVQETKRTHDEEHIRIVLQDVMQGVRHINYKIGDPEINAGLSFFERSLFYVGNIFGCLIFAFLPLLWGSTQSSLTRPSC